MLHPAKQALEAIRGESRAPVNVYPFEKKPEPLPDAIFPAGTIINCPSYGEGLYKVAQEASTSDLVLDDGTTIHPLILLGLLLVHPCHGCVALYLLANTRDAFCFGGAYSTLNRAVIPKPVEH